MSETSPAQKPTIVLVHGAYHRPEHWGLLQAALYETGYPTLAVDLPVDNPNLSQDDDAQAVADATNGLDNILVVAHSRSGDFLARALERSNASRRVGVFLCASGFGVELPDGMPPRNSPDFERGIQEIPNGLTRYDPYRARRYFYPYHRNDEIAPVFRAVRAVATLLLRPQRARTKSSEPLPESLPEGIKFYSIHGSRDSIVDPKWSEKVEQHLGIDSIVIPDGHSPYIANPWRLARVLAKLALHSQSESTHPIPRQRIPDDQMQPPIIPRHFPPRATPGRYTNEEIRAIANATRGNSEASAADD